MECSLDGAPFAACTSPQSYTSLDEGAHTFEVRAIDQAANPDPSPASYAWTVDTVAPDTPTIDSSTSGHAGQRQRAEVAGTAAAGSTVRLYKAPTAADCTPANLAATGSAQNFTRPG